MLNMKTMEDRFRNDVIFNRLVKYMEQAIEELRLTPSEVRAAAMYATIRVECRNPMIRPLVREMEERVEKDAHLLRLMKAETN